jgi:anti-anti-sigma factor
MDFIDDSIGNTKILAINGSLDRNTVLRFKKQLESISAVQPCFLVINLEGVTHIDQSGLSVLVAGLKQCQSSGGDLYLCCLPDRIRILFELTRLNLTFEIFPTEDAALQLIRSEAARAGRQG